MDVGVALGGVVGFLLVLVMLSQPSKDEYIRKITPEDAPPNRAPMWVVVLMLLMIGVGLVIASMGNTGT